MIQKIGIEQLPRYSPWVARLLGLEPFVKPVRNFDKTDKEYNKGKYTELLSYFLGKKDISVHEVKSREIFFGKPVICISREAQLYLTSPEEYLSLEREILVKILAEPISAAATILELGCGYGYNLATLQEAYPGRVWIGGECSQNAIKLANHLFSDNKTLSVLPFNWYDGSWPIFENVAGKALVITRHAVEQLPSVKDTLPNFRRYKEKISAIVHLEPVYELADKDTTLGLLRRAYTMMNDYCTDLLTNIRETGGNILNTRYDLIGGNPLNPTSMVYWRF